MSTSYPYLEIARRHGVSYGHVLAYADVVRKVRIVMESGALSPQSVHTDMDHWEREALEVIGGGSVDRMPLSAVTRDIRDAYLTEHLRRQRAAT